MVGVEATGINACPCAQGLVARPCSRAALERRGSILATIEQILKLVPIATHNQRGRGTLLVGTAQRHRCRDARRSRRALDELSGLRAAQAPPTPRGRHLRLSAGAADGSSTTRPTLVSDAPERARSLHRLGLRRESGILADYRAPEVESGPVDAINGAFMLFRRSALDQVGLFDEGYWMYMEDLDLCYRFAQAGWVTWYEPSATVIHIKAGSSGPVRSPKLNYAFHYGMFRFYRKHYATTRSMLVSAIVYAGIAAKLVFSVVRNAFRDSDRGSAPGRSLSRS